MAKNNACTNILKNLYELYIPHKNNVDHRIFSFNQHLLKKIIAALSGFLIFSCLQLAAEGIQDPAQLKPYIEGVQVDYEECLNKLSELETLNNSASAMTTEKLLPEFVSSDKEFISKYRKALKTTTFALGTQKNILPQLCTSKGLFYEMSDLLLRNKKDITNWKRYGITSMSAKDIDAWTEKYATNNNVLDICISLISNHFKEKQKILHNNANLSVTQAEVDYMNRNMELLKSLSNKTTDYQQGTCMILVSIGGLLKPEEQTKQSTSDVSDDFLKEEPAPGPIQLKGIF